MMQLVGSAPVILTVVMLILSRELRHEEKENVVLLRYAAVYAIAPLCFFCKAVWFQLILLAAWPSRDDASLPRKFLAILFLDVFGDAAYDPTEAEQAGAQASGNVLQETRVAAAETQLETGHAALRRWEAIPHELLTGDQA